MTEELNVIQMQLKDINTSHETVITDFKMEIDEGQEIIETSANKITILGKSKMPQKNRTVPYIL